MNMGWERILPMKIYDNLNTWKYIVMFLLNVVISISKPIKKPLQYHNCTRLCKIAYK